jgi:hypothetical protein
MSSQRRPLRGDRRKSTAPKKKTPAKPPARARRRRKAAPARRRPLILRLLFALFGALARLFWAIGWRVAVIGGLILGGFTLWHASRLPSDPAALVDQRARGSVTLLDRYGRPFAWRGDMFGGMIRGDRDRGQALSLASRHRPDRHRQRDPDQPARGPRSAGGAWRFHHHPAGREAHVPRRALRSRDLGQRGGL